ncbi:alpha-galactosidase [Actinomadura vinacea]|uniref:Alpha-galactosidase n=1 Tax=Actinomadura vinacea TaxID=115336 RepID=A0ABN3JL64_9ACTN
MIQITQVPVDPVRGRVYEHGWQSWSPSAAYPVTATGERPRQDPRLQTMCWRPDRPAPGQGFQGEGLLAVEPGDGSPARLFAARDGLLEVPSVRARLHRDRLVIEADGPVDEIPHPGGIEAALARWADLFTERAGVRPPRPAPTVWCTWYHYFGEVTEADIAENLAAIADRGLPVEVVQIDDGWQAGIGDWLDDRIDLPAMVSRIRADGRRAGVWIAPFLVAAGSDLARAHPEWLGGDAGHNWNRPLHALDTTHPGARDHLRRVFARLRDLGVDYYKLDFLYAGALPGLSAYRDAIALIRETVGPEAYLLGCGAPILPSAGLFDAMRVGPDIGLTVAPPDGDLSRPSQHAATMTTVARAWQHGRLWVNDPDCLIVRPAVEDREAWARTVERYGGLRASSDRILDLDDWGLETTRRLLAAPPPPTPFKSPPAGRQRP